MNCADFEILLCDHLDGTLAADAKAEFEAHLAQCTSCAEMAHDVRAAVGFMERAAEVEPPPELLTRILFDLPSAHHARARQPGSFRKLIHGWIQPVLQPRFAMGFAMTILSFSLLGRFVGISPRQLTLDDLRPARVLQRLDEQVNRGWQRTVKFYENLRLVYEIQTQLREWSQKEQEFKGRAEDEQAPAAAPRPQSSSGETPAAPGSAPAGAPGADSGSTK